MMTDGLLEEIKQLLPYQHLNPLNTVGYTELFDFMAGKHTLEEAISLIKQNTRRFAKRQLTWFRKDAEIVWLNAEQPTIDFENWLIIEFQWLACFALRRIIQITFDFENLMCYILKMILFEVL